MVVKLTNGSYKFHIVKVLETGPHTLPMLKKKVADRLLSNNQNTVLKSFKLVYFNNAFVQLKQHNDITTKRVRPTRWELTTPSKKTRKGVRINTRLNTVCEFETRTCVPTLSKEDNHRLVQHAINTVQNELLTLTSVQGNTQHLVKLGDVQQRLNKEFKTHHIQFTRDSQQSNVVNKAAHDILHMLSLQ